MTVFLIVLSGCYLAEGVRALRASKIRRSRIQKVYLG